MLILIAAAMLAAPGSPVIAGESPVPAAPARCKPANHSASETGRSRVLKLGEMPPAQQIRTVWRFDANGCPYPLVVRSQVGADGR